MPAFKGVELAPNNWLRLDVAEEDDESPRGYTALLVASGGRGASSSSVLTFGSAAGDSLGLFEPNREKPLGFGVSFGVLNKPPDGVSVLVACPKSEVPGVDVAKLNLDGPGVVVGVVDSWLCWGAKIDRGLL